MRPRLTEAQIQRSVFDHLATRAYPRVVAFHCPNGGFRPRVEAAIFKGMGVRAGVSDVIACYAGDFFALELKAPGQKPTAEQLEFIAAVNDAGGYATWTDNLDRALNILEMWGLIKPNRNAASA